MVQGSLGTILADHATRATDALAAGGAEAKRAFDAMMTMGKIDVAAIEGIGSIQPAQVDPKTFVFGTGRSL
jgi:hypothetical protein